MAEDDKAAESVQADTWETDSHISTATSLSSAVSAAYK